MGRINSTGRLRKRHAFFPVLFCMAMMSVLPAGAAQAAQPTRGETSERRQEVKNTRSLVGEIGFRNAAYDRLKQNYGYPWLYPQAFAIDADAKELFVMLGSISGQNMWGWVQVYDLDNFKLKSTFSTGQRWREGLVIRRIGGQRFLYTMGNTSLIRVDVTKLPRDISVLEPEALPARLFSMMAFDGSHFALQEPHGPGGFLGPQKFGLYDEKFRRGASVTLTAPKADNSTSPSTDAKMQGIASTEDRFFAGFGGAYLPGVHKKDGKWQGTVMFDRTGAVLSSSLVDPDVMAASLERLIGYRPTCVENEGVAVAGDEVYSIWITLGPKERERPDNAGKGVVLMRELFTAGMDGDDQ